METTKPILSKSARVLLNIGLAIATLIIVLDYSIANVAIPYIAGDLAVSNDQGTYVITAFAVGNGIVLAISGWLTRRFGAVRLIVVSIILFVFFSWLCGAAPNFEVLVVSRFLQGAVSGPLIPISQTLLLTHNPIEKRNNVMAMWSAVVIVGPVIGPILGGWLTFDYSWPWIFFINIPIGLASAFIIWVLLHDHETSDQNLKMEWVGLILLTIGVSCLQIFLDKGQQWDWFRSPAIRTLSIGCLLSLTFLVLWEYSHPRPMLDLKLFKVRSFSVSVICIAVAYAMYFGSVVLIPLWLQTNMGYTAPWAGIAVAPLGIAPILSTKLSAKAITKLGKLIPLSISFAFFALSSFYTAFFTTDVDIWHVGFSRFLSGCGFIFFITPLIALSVQDMPQEKLANAASIFHFIRAIFGGIGTSIFTTLWLRRTYYHHERLGEALTPFTYQTQEFNYALGQTGFSQDKALHLLNHAVDNQAALLSQNDCFWLMGFLYILLIFLLPLAAKRKTTSVVTP